MDDDDNTIIGGAGGWWEADFCDGAASGRRRPWCGCGGRCGMNLPPVLELEGEGVSINFGGGESHSLDVLAPTLFWRETDTY